MYSESIFFSLIIPVYISKNYFTVSARFIIHLMLPCIHNLMNWWSKHNNSIPTNPLANLVPLQQEWYFSFDHTILYTRTGHTNFIFKIFYHFLELHFWGQVCWLFWCPLSVKLGTTGNCILFQSFQSQCQIFFIFLRLQETQIYSMTSNVTKDRNWA